MEMSPDGNFSPTQLPDFSKNQHYLIVDIYDRKRARNSRLHVSIGEYSRSVVAIPGSSRCLSLRRFFQNYVFSHRLAR
jgi:hypothetical protein